jgi:hypothetical protein
MPSALPTLRETDDFIFSLESVWITETRVGIAGWCIGKASPIVSLTVKLADEPPLPITQWELRPDLQSKCDMYNSTNRCGFAQEFERPKLRSLTASIGFDNTRCVTCDLDYLAGIPPPDIKMSTPVDLWPLFFSEVNERNLSVLEIGSRVVMPSSTPKRAVFSGVARYVGFDYHAGQNVDIVGDVHRLAQDLSGEQFGAIFSLSVMEHLAMPWVAALEMVKSLEVGGIMFHNTPFSWPLHELPWDFWRFSAEAYRVLFPKALGIRIEHVSYAQPMHLYFDIEIPGQARFPISQSYGHAAVLVRKVEEVNYSRFRWNISLEELLGVESHYPPPHE